MVVKPSVSNVPIWSAATRRRFPDGRHVSQFQSAVMPAHSKFGRHPSISTPSMSHKNSLMRAAHWRMAAEIFAGMKSKLKNAQSCQHLELHHLLRCLVAILPLSV
ncbi:MAG TPA: hypothetical protein VGI63_04525 [Verrucomicrobiae bacterium]|jgi:hypothetical protein